VSPPRPRRKQREQERALRKQVRRTDHPIDVPSASVVEGKARATPCVQCGGDLELGGDRATSTARGLLREIALACRRCHAPRTLWFRITPPAVN
jgi:hypothetical protein